MKKFIILILLLGLFQSVEAQFNKVGRTSMQFLKIGIGGRESSLGEACIANPKDINSVFWNPAGITMVDNIGVSFHYTKWMINLNVFGGAAGINLGDLGVVAFDYVILDYGDLQEATVTSPSGNLDTRTGNIFSGKDLAFGVSYARKFTDKLAIGVRIKYLREDLYKYTTNLLAFDIGSYYDTGWKGIKIAMSAQNFSSQARWLNTGQEAQQSYEIPLVFRIGWSIDLLGGQNLFLGGDPNYHRLTFNMDAIHSNDYAERLNMGLEYVFLNQFYLRGGYRFNYDEGKLSGGVGFLTSLADFDLQLDYSYVVYDYLDSTHRFSLSIAF